jgi:HK97 family phage prohead protease
MSTAAPASDSTTRAKLLYRASAELHAESGRTLVGVAMPWNTPALVSDPGTAPYFEAFSRSAFDRSLQQNPGPRPLFDTHEYMLPAVRRADPKADPIGVAHFERSESGLVFRAVLSQTHKADEQLALVNDGAKRSVSVGFRALRSRNQRVGNKFVTMRTEVALRELSLAPTGMGVYEGAKVLAVRASRSRLDELRALLATMDAQARRADRITERLTDYDAMTDGLLARADYERKWGALVP